jgi:hypothetical protein
MDPNVKEYLRILEADHREMHLRLGSKEPLRTQRSRSQQRRFRQLREDLKAQAKERFDRRSRRAYRRDVSIEMSLFLSDNQSTSTTRIVKAYLDVLKGIVYGDDRSIAHLMVDRFDIDSTSDLDELLSDPSKQPTEVFITVKPIRIYREQFQRALRASWDSYGDESAWERSERSGEPEMLLELARDVHVLFPNMTDEERREVALGFQRDAQRAITELVSSVPFTSQDFPGGSAEPRGFAGMLPGEILLPLPHLSPQETPWVTEIEHRLSEHRRRWRLLKDPLHPPLAVDIAVPGGGSFVDLDNLAAALIGHVQKAFFSPASKSPIGTYRVYRVDNSSRLIRVRLMDPMIVRSLPDAMQDTQEELRRRPPEGFLDPAF